MATISLTMENFSYAEPMKKNRFLVQFQAESALGDSVNGLTIACHSSTIPNLTIEEQELHRFNDRVYIPSKGAFNTVDIGFYEYIKTTNSIPGDGKNAGDILWDWQKKVYNPSTGVSGYKQDITSNLIIIQFDGAGNVVRTWNLYHAWPTVVNFDELNSESGEIQNVTVTLRYDWAEMANMDGIPEPDKPQSK